MEVLSWKPASLHSRLNLYLNKATVSKGVSVHTAADASSKLPKGNTQNMYSCGSDMLKRSVLHTTRFLWYSRKQTLTFLSKISFCLIHWCYEKLKDSAVLFFSLSCCICALAITLKRSENVKFQKSFERPRGVWNSCNWNSCCECFKILLSSYECITH